MKQHLTKQTLRIYWQHLMRYKGWFVLTILSTITASILSVIAPIYIKQLLDAAINGEPRAVLISVLITFTTITLVQSVIKRGMLFVTAHIDSIVMRDLADSAYQYLHLHSTNFFNNSFVGSLVKRVNRFYRGFESVFDHTVFDFLPILIEIGVIALVLSARSPWLPVALIMWVSLYLLVNLAFNRFKLKYDIEKSAQDTKVTGVLADTITNHENVKLFNGYEREVSRFHKESDTLRRFRRRSWFMAEGFEAFQVFLMIGLEFLMFYLAIGLYNDGTITIGDFALLQAYLGRIFMKLWSLSHIFRNIYESMADAKEMTEIMLQEHDLTDHRLAKDVTVKRGEIAFKDVRFNYNQTRTVIPNLNLQIPAGQKVGLVGLSGAGKTTIAKLLLRKHDVSKGRILIDGVRLDRMTLESIWAAMGLVPQDPVLFHRTLMENIRYGKPSATDEEVIAAAKLAHAHEFISGFPDGYDTLVGERGVKLSGGERQRVAIARAMLKNAPILLLDEATSALDSESEMLIQDALETLMKGKTTIVVAHRLSTIMKMDRIIVLDKGRIIEDGTHSKLLKKKTGIYTRLWNLQVGSFNA